MNEQLFDTGPEEENKPDLDEDDRSNSYRVIARRYRPARFTDVLGQEHVTRTLKNAIREDRLGHAYLFSGPRGIGKTSTARILARAVNCEEGVSPEPCNECSVCRKLEIGSTPDIIEIDAASQRGIDDIRNLRETVRYSPLHSSYRVYIIDEAHMLSRDAFNAFLKTLEEPPDHVLFVFATTEPEKMPDTIISRCQPFQFNRIPHTVMLDRLVEITEEEEIDVSRGILSEVCRAADGSLRDAQSTLDQLISISEDGIDEQDLKLVLGTVSSDTLNHVLEGISKGDAQSVLERIHDVYQGGGEIDVFLEQLISHLRDLLVVHSCGADTDLVDAGENERQQLANQVDLFNRSVISEMIKSLVNVRSRTQNLYQSRLLLETELVRLCEQNTNSSSDSKKNDRINESSPPDSYRDRKEETEEEPFTESSAASRPEPEESDQVKTDPDDEATNHDGGARSDGASDARDESKANIPETDEELQDAWNTVLEKLDELHSTTAALAGEAEPDRIEGKDIVIWFSSEYNYHVEKLSEGERKEHLIDVLQSEIHPDLGLRVERQETSSETESTENQEENEEGEETRDNTGDRDDSDSSSNGVENDPDVQKAIDFFDADIVNVEE